MTLLISLKRTKSSLWMSMLSIFMAGSAISADTLLARNLAATCAGCHGTNGHAVSGEIKSLAGMESAKLLEALKSYQSGEKPATIMHQITKGYTDAQLTLIANYYAQQKP